MPTLSAGSSNNSGFRRNNASSGGRIAIIFVVLSLILFTASARDTGTGPFSVVRGVVSTIVMPVRFVGAAVTATFGMYAKDCERVHVTWKRSRLPVAGLQ